MHCRIIFYGQAAIWAPDVQRFLVGENKKFLACPNIVHVIRVESLRHANSTAIDLTNAVNVSFSILVCISINGRRQELTRIRYNGQYIIIDKRWELSEQTVKRRIAKAPNLLPIDFITVELDFDDILEVRKSRFDIQLNDGNFLGVFYDKNGVIFSRFNGNYVVNRLGLLINRCVRSSIRQRAEQAMIVPAAAAHNDNDGASETEDEIEEEPVKDIDDNDNASETEAKIEEEPVGNIDDNSKDDVLVIDAASVVLEPK